MTFSLNALSIKQYSTQVAKQFQSFHECFLSTIMGKVVKQQAIWLTSFIRDCMVSSWICCMCAWWASSSRQLGIEREGGHNYHLHTVTPALTTSTGWRAVWCSSLSSCGTSDQAQVAEVRVYWYWQSALPGPFFLLYSLSWSHGMRHVTTKTFSNHTSHRHM